jgi:hypothetical protein
MTDQTYLSRQHGNGMVMEKGFRHHHDGPRHLSSLAAEVDMVDC